MSPTGTVHAIETDNSLIPDIADEYKDYVTTMCHHFPGFNGQGWIDAYEVDWPKTDKPVSCKRCLSALKRNKG